MSRTARLESLVVGCLLAVVATLFSDGLERWIFGGIAVLAAAWWLVELRRGRPCEARVIQNQWADVLIRRWDGSHLVIRDPMGNEHRASSGWPASWLDQDVNVSYPRDFPTAPTPLTSGKYVVTLRGPGRIRRKHEVVRGACEFLVPEGESGWFVRWEAINIANEDAVTIFVQSGPGARVLRGLQCELWSPGQARSEVPARAKVESGTLSDLIPQATYPKDFEGGEPLRDGVYRGRWTAWSSDAPVGAQGRRTLVRWFALRWPGLEEVDSNSSL